MRLDGPPSLRACRGASISLEPRQRGPMIGDPSALSASGAPEPRTEMAKNCIIAGRPIHAEAAAQLNPNGRPDGPRRRAYGAAFGRSFLGVAGSYQDASPHPDDAYYSNNYAAPHPHRRDNTTPEPARPRRAPRRTPLRPEPRARRPATATGASTARTPTNSSPATTWTAEPWKPAFPSAFSRPSGACSAQLRRPQRSPFARRKNSCRWRVSLRS